MAILAKSRGDIAYIVGAFLLISGATVLYRSFVPVANPTTVSLSFLLVILLVATKSSLRVAIAAAFFAAVLFNFFFLPPVGTFTVRDLDNWIALVVFLVVGVVASNLSSKARTRAQEAIARRDEVTRLFDLSRDVLLATESDTVLPSLPRHIARRFELVTAALFLPRSDGWIRYDGGVRASALDDSRLDTIFAEAGGALEFDARRRTYGGQQAFAAVDGTAETVVPLRMGTQPVGLLSAAGGAVDPGALDAVGGVAAIAVERARLLGECKTADLERQRAELASALLASFSHDLRTPLTAIRVAVANLVDSGLSHESRREQAEIALREVHRLNRAFEVILDMARIDAGISPERKWVTPAEVVDAAIAHVAAGLDAHRLEVDAEQDCEIEVDPRLTAAALAHVIENAAQHSPSGSVIRIVSVVVSEGLETSVLDQGPGLAPRDVDHLFERFYQGARKKTDEGSFGLGLGLGLSITRGLLAAEGGRIWADNRPEGGARFTMLVPARRRSAPLAAEESN